MGQRLPSTNDVDDDDGGGVLLGAHVRLNGVMRSKVKGIRNGWAFCLDYRWAHGDDGSREMLMLGVLCRRREGGVRLAMSCCSPGMGPGG